jgi:hypothetical protein
MPGRGTGGETWPQVMKRMGVGAGGLTRCERFGMVVDVCWMLE